MQFTIFTPTYNRAHTLDRVYKSLLSQTFTEFEWVIVDDGSTDKTEKIVENWKNLAPFPITYIKQDNLGKHIAINNGLDHAQGEFFLIADSDDSFKSDTLEIFLNNWCDIPDENKPNYAGVTCLVEKENGDIVGDRFPSDVVDSNYGEMTYRFNVHGEKWGFYRTDLMRLFRVPDELAPHYAPGLIWQQIGEKYKIRFINCSLRVYFQDAGGQISRKAPHKAAARWFTYAIGIDGNIQYLTTAPLQFLKLAILGSRLAFHHRQGFLLQLRYSTTYRSKLIWMLGMPFGAVLCVVDKVRR